MSQENILWKTNKLQMKLCKISFKYEMTTQKKIQVDLLVPDDDDEADDVNDVDEAKLAIQHESEFQYNLL